MKCTSIKLTSKNDQPKVKTRSWENTISDIFVAEQTHSYCFPFIRNRSSLKNKAPSLAVTNLNLPLDFKGFNAGSSLDKWSKKRSRLKSCSSKNVSARSPSNNTEDDKDFCYESLDTDLSFLLKESDEGFADDDSLSLTNLQYEVHSDIEKLILDSQRTNTSDFCPDQRKKLEKKRRKKRAVDKTLQVDQKLNRKSKSIKFSVSKPASPQTEQIIRVDVVSSVSALLDNKATPSPDYAANFAPKLVVNDAMGSQAQEGMTNAQKDEFERNPSEEDTSGVGREQKCDEDFIVRCRQLALKQRGRCPSFRLIK